jgi:aspartyl aminopeptidase
MNNSQMVSIHIYLFIRSFNFPCFQSFSSGSDLNTYCCKFQILAKELNCTTEEILDFELSVWDTQPSYIGGARKEFIFSGRLDNLASSFCALRALPDTCEDAASLTDESCIRVVALFDDEEVYVSFPLLC